MARLLALSFLLANAAADAGLRGGVSAQRDPSLYDSLFGKSDSSSDNVDPMDMYIKASKTDAGSKVWWSKSESKKDPFDHSSTGSVLDHSKGSIFDHSDIFDHPSAASKMDSIFDHSSRGASKMDSIFDHSSEPAAFKPSRSMFGSDTDTFAADKDMFAVKKEPSRSAFDKDTLAADKEATVNMMHSASRSSSSVSMSHSAGSDSSSNGGGAVIDIKLDSELQESQESLLQKAKKSRRSVSKAGSAPDVEAAVASQRLEDVYIHDQFSAAADADVKKEQEVHANPDMKA